MLDMIGMSHRNILARTTLVFIRNQPSDPSPTSSIDPPPILVRGRRSLLLLLLPKNHIYNYYIIDLTGTLDLVVVWNEPQRGEEAQPGMNVESHPTIQVRSNWDRSLFGSTLSDEWLAFRPAEYRECKSNERSTGYGV